MEERHVDAIARQLFQAPDPAVRLRAIRAIGAAGVGTSRLSALLEDPDGLVRAAAADALGFEFQGTFAKRVDGKFVGYGVEEWRLD